MTKCPQCGYNETPETQKPLGNVMSEYVDLKTKLSRIVNSVEKVINIATDQEKGVIAATLVRADHLEEYLKQGVTKATETIVPPKPTKETAPTASVIEKTPIVDNKTPSTGTETVALPIHDGFGNPLPTK